MTKEEIAKRFCKFELCTHRNGEGMCCLYNQDNCIFHRLEKENAELRQKLTEKVTLESLDVVSARITDLEKENERLTVSYETLKLHDQEEIEILKSENAELKGTIADIEKNFRICESNADTCYDQLTKAKGIMNIAIEGIKNWGIVGGNERPFEKQADMLFNLFLEKSEQFLKEIEK